MSKEGANIKAVHLLKQFRTFLIKTQEDMRGALSDAESDVRRTKSWLESDQVDHWKAMLRKADKQLQQAKNDLRRKELAPTSNNRPPSAIEERKAVQKAQAHVEHAREKLMAIKRSHQILEKAAQQFRSSIQRLAQSVDGNIPRAVARLDKQIDALDQYLALAEPDSVGSQVETASQATMRRAVDQDNKTEVKNVKDSEDSIDENQEADT